MSPNHRLGVRGQGGSKIAPGDPGTGTTIPSITSTSLSPPSYGETLSYDSQGTQQEPPMSQTAKVAITPVRGALGSSGVSFIINFQKHSWT